MSSYIKKKSCDFVVTAENTGKVLALSQRFLPDALYCFTLDGAGSIVDVKVEGCILSEMREMLTAIAPWVREGSYISMFSDDGSLWRWTFHNGKCQEIPAKIHWTSETEVSTTPKERDQVVILVKEGHVTDVLCSDQRVDVEVLDFDTQDEQELDSLSQQWDAYRKNYFPIY